MSVKALSMQHLTIIYHNGHAYRVNFMFMSKNDAFNLIKNSIIIKKERIKKEHYKVKNNNFLSVYSMKLSLQKIKFGDKEVNKKEFYSSKEAIFLDSVDLSK